MPSATRVQSVKSCLLTGCLGIAAVFLLIFAVLAVLCLRAAWLGSKNERYFDALRNGKCSEPIVSIVLDSRRSPVVITDPDSIAFFAKAFRTIEPFHYDGHRTRMYDIEINFAKGKCSRLSIAPFLDGSGMEVGFIWSGWIEDDVYYDATFSEGPPPELQRVFDRWIAEAQRKDGSTTNDPAND